jgi:hypothetical protein
LRPTASIPGAWPLCCKNTNAWPAGHGQKARKKLAANAATACHVHTYCHPKMSCRQQAGVKLLPAVPDCQQGVYATGCKLAAHRMLLALRLPPVPLRHPCPIPLVGPRLLLDCCLSRVPAPEMVPHLQLAPHSLHEGATHQVIICCTPHITRSQLDPVPMPFCMCAACLLREAGSS